MGVFVTNDLETSLDQEASDLDQLDGAVQEQHAAPVQNSEPPLSRYESRRLKLTAKGAIQDRAAQLVAEDELSDSQIGRLCGIDRRTLTRWKKRLQFQEKIEQIRTVWKQELEGNSVSARLEHLALLDWSWKAMLEFVDHRARSPEMQNVPGGKTGLLYSRQKSFVSSGEVHILKDYYLDVKLLKALRRLEVRAAKQSGQWGRPLSAQPGLRLPPPHISGTALSGKREQAANLAARDQLPDAEIAAGCRINRRTLSRWRREPEFQARIQECRERLDEACEFGIGDKLQRLIALDKRWRDLNQIVLERSASFRKQEEPGGTTGIQCQRQKVLRLSDGDRVTYSEFPFDYALLRELLSHEMQAAKELGQVRVKRRKRRRARSSFLAQFWLEILKLREPEPAPPCNDIRIPLHTLEHPAESAPNPT